MSALEECLFGWIPVTRSALINPCWSQKVAWQRAFSSQSFFMRLCIARLSCPGRQMQIRCHGVSKGDYLGSRKKHQTEKMFNTRFVSLSTRNALTKQVFCGKRGHQLSIPIYAPLSERKGKKILNKRIPAFSCKLQFFVSRIPFFLGISWCILAVSCTVLLWRSTRTQAPVDLYDISLIDWLKFLWLTTLHLPWEVSCWF